MILDLWRNGVAEFASWIKTIADTEYRPAATGWDIDFNMVKFDYTNYCRTTRNALGIAKEQAKRERHATSPGRQFPQFAQ